jgi:hypothetical protein
MPRAERAAPPETARLEWVLFAAALAAYIVTRLAGIVRYPIFFFCDEALQDNIVVRLLHNGFRDEAGTFLPPYFLNDRRWAVSLSVYIHLLPVWIFGPSIACVRATTAFVSLAGVAAGGLALKEMRNRFWWSAPLVAGATPLFFVHARLGFETAMMASFYFCFLWAYFLYRSRDARWIFGAIAFGAATFYAYTAGQGVMLVTGLVLLLSDLPYHLRLIRRRKALFAGALLFALVLASPYVRYRKLHPGVVSEQLAVLDSYWTQAIPLSAKIAQFGRNYRAGLDPHYWFQLNGAEAERHRMDGMAFLPPAFAPLMAIGVLACLWNFRRSSLHRAVLFSPLGVPFAAAAANLQILRLMAMVVPATLLTCVGIDWIFRGLSRLRVPWAPVAIAGAAALTFQNARLTYSALTEGPLWASDYGLYGMQWGAREIFGAIREELPRFPDALFIVSSTWSNNPQEFIPFFLKTKERTHVRIGDIREWDLHPTPLSGHEVFVMTREEWKIATESKKFVVPPPIRTIPYPDGQPGFRLARIRYADNAADVFTAEREARAVLVDATVTVGTETWTVRHSRLDMGDANAIFDGRIETMARGFEANPVVIDITFPTPRPVHGIGVGLGAMDVVTVTLKAFAADGTEKVARTNAPNRPPQKSIEVALPAPVTASRVRVEMTEGEGTNPTHMEIRDLRVR